LIESVQPIIVVGAARSGTKLLRDCLGEHPSVSVVPYDVNFLWKLGNESVQHDELSPECATPDAVRRVRAAILRFARTPVLVEKTVSNSLRVPFVRTVFPEAVIVHLVRDGIDVVESAQRQWLERPDARYLFAKLRAVGIRGSTGYLTRYAIDTVRRLGPAARPPMWGPIYDGMGEDYAQRGLAATCALQWDRSARSSLEHRAEGDLFLKYEDFVDEPDAWLERILGSHVRGSVHTIKDVRKDRVGAGSSLTPEARAEVLEIIASTRAALGYGLV
jgi:hypothetical protein